MTSSLNSDIVSPLCICFSTLKCNLKDARSKKLEIELDPTDIQLKIAHAVPVSCCSGLRKNMTTLNPKLVSTQHGVIQ